MNKSLTAAPIRKSKAKSIDRVTSVELISRKEFAAESKADIEWRSPKDALQIYATQCQMIRLPELDERVIIQRFIAAYGL